MRKTSIREYMTPAPHTIGADQPLTVASEIMTTHHIRHLPVLRAGHAVGILSQRDVQLVSGLPLVNPAHVTVEEAMSEDIYAVAPDTPLDEVAATMADNKYGAALVTEHGRVTGIFTTIDALAVLAEGTPSHPRKRRAVAH
jgi:acetoin utilization protein AcuB